MKIRVSEIGKNGLHIVTSRKPEWLAHIPELVSDKEGVRLSSDINFDLQVTKVLREITVRGNIWFSTEAPCARCLKTVDLILKPEVNSVLSPKHVPHEKGEDEDADYETYSGDEIDLSGYLREVIAMSLPIKALCREGCKGLCPYCGTDLNVNPCSCKNDWADPRFTALRNLKF